MRCRFLSGIETSIGIEGAAEDEEAEEEDADEEAAEEDEDDV